MASRLPEQKGTLQDQLKAIRGHVPKTSIEIDMDVQSALIQVGEMQDQDGEESNGDTTPRPATQDEPSYIDGEGHTMFDRRKSFGQAMLKIKLANGSEVEVPISDKDRSLFVDTSIKQTNADLFNSYVNTALGVAGFVALALGVFFGIKAEVKK